MESYWTRRRRVMKNVNRVMGEPAEFSEMESTTETLSNQSTSHAFSPTLVPEFSNTNENEFNSYKNMYSDHDYPFDLDSFTLCERLKRWSVSHMITMTALNELLEILGDYHKELPKDGRTLLKRSADKMAYRTVSPGEYYHFGIVSGLHFILSKIVCPDTILLNIFVDGASIYKNTTSSIWPILGALHSVPNSVFVIGIYSGPRKPDSVSDYLQEAIIELKRLETFPTLTEGNHSYTIKLNFILGDAPARCFMKCVKSVTGKYGCDRCIQEGKYVGRVIFPEFEANPRTDASFRSFAQEEYHHMESPFTQLNVDMVLAFPLDPMHLLYEGVVHKFCEELRRTSLPFRLSSAEQSKIDELLLHYACYVPSDFPRRPRSYKRHLGLWKATEFRLFILYMVPGIIPNVLSNEKVMETFLCLSVLVTIISHPNLSKQSQLLSYASSLAKAFLEKSTVLFGETFLVYNSHALIHLIDEVRRNGPIETFSCFPYENFLRFLKKCVLSPYKPLQQIVNRVSGYDVCLGQLIQPQSALSGNAIAVQNFYLKLNERDCYFMTNDDHVYKLIEIHENRMLCKRFLEKEDAFLIPIKSSLLDIHRVSRLGKVKEVNKNSIKCKCMVLPTSEYNSIALPLLHTVSSRL